jgi:transposase
MIILDSKSQLIVDIIAKVSIGKISISNATKLLSLSHRTIQRYLNQYHAQGIKFIIHVNTGRKPKNKISDDLTRTVQTLIKEKYYDVNLQHLAKLLEIYEGTQVKRKTLRPLGT